MFGSTILHYTYLLCISSFLFHSLIAMVDGNIHCTCVSNEALVISAAENLQYFLSHWANKIIYYVLSQVPNN